MVSKSNQITMTPDIAYALKVIVIAAANGSIVSNVDQIINMIDRMSEDAQPRTLARKVGEDVREAEARGWVFDEGFSN